jgi:hypothetical protein
MLKKHLIKTLALSLIFGSGAQALTLDWTGGYRFEWTEVDRPSLASPGQRKAYGLNYLYLSPQIIAADGVNIYSRFDVLNSTEYPNSQVGQIWGSNSNSTSSTAAVGSDNQGSTDLRVSQLYLTINQEYGALLVGRAPFEFGLGMSYSAGKGAFDHWYSTRDMMAYKIVVGDWFFMPILSRLRSTDFGQGGTISSTAFQLQYENKDSQTVLGVLHETMAGVKESLDYTNDQITAYGATAEGGNLKAQKTSVTFGRGFDSFGFKLEAGFLTGETGLINGAQNVNLNGYGIASEFYVPRGEGKWDWTVKLGLATGKDPASNDFGAFAFNRNYDVAMLMFNHRLGQRDFFNTDVVKDTSKSVGNSADDESISNAIYFAPSAKYSWSDRLDIRNTLVYGQLMNVQKNSVDSSKDLGLEWDIDVIYRPSERVQWVNQVGLLFPGAAFKNGNDDLENAFNYGFATKAAISF